MYNQTLVSDFLFMRKLTQNKGFSSETMAMLFIVAFVAAFILAQFLIGFHFGLFVVSMVVSVGLVLRWPRAGLFAMIVLMVVFERFYTLQPILIGLDAYKLYPIDIFIFAIVVAAAMRMLSGKIRHRFRAADWLLLAFFGAVTAIFILSMVGFGDRSFETAFSTWKSYVFYGAVYFLVSFFVSKKEHLAHLVKIFLAASAAATIFVFIGIVRGEGLWTQYTPLSTSGIRILAFPHAYYFALALLVALYSAKHWFVSHGSKRWFFLGIISLWIVGIFGSLMRHLWLGLGASVFVMLWLIAREYRKSILDISRVLIVGGMVIFLISFYFIVLFPRSDMGDRMTDLSSTLSERIVSIGDSSDESIAWRGVVWGSALHAFSQNAISGTGFGMNVPVEIDDYREFVEIRNIHNSWLALLIQTGVIGFGLFVAFLFVLIRSVWRRYSDDPVLETSKYATVGILSFQSIVFLSQPYLETNLLSVFFWLNLGVMRSLLDYENTRNQ